MERCMDLTSSPSSPSSPFYPSSSSSSSYTSSPLSLYSSGASTGAEVEAGPHEVEAGNDEQDGDGQDTIVSV